MLGQWPLRYQASALSCYAAGLLPRLLLQQSCLHQHPGNNIWIKVPGGPSVLQVAALLQGHQIAHSDRRASVSHSPPSTESKDWCHKTHPH